MGPSAQARKFLCFTDHDPDDIVLRQAKIVGSAQRRRSGAVLQHGSLLLGLSGRTPELPGLSDLASASTEVDRWAEVLRSILPAALGLAPEAGDLTVVERSAAASLASGKYADPAWTGKR